MDNSEKGVIERLRQFRGQNDITIQGLSDALEFPRGTLEKYLNGPKYPNVEFLLKFSAKYGVSLHWLLEGVGPVFLREQAHQTSASEAQAFVQVPRFSVEVSAGAGAAQEHEETTGFYAFNREWLTRRGLEPEWLAVIRVRGDSGEPNLSDGDLILVNRAEREVVDGLTYVLRLGTDLVVKSVQRLAASRIALLSANPMYPPREIELEGMDGEIEIVGRLIVSMHEW